MKRLVLFLAVVSAPAWAGLPELSASLGYTGQVYTSRTFDLVSSVDPLSLVRVGAAVTVPVAVGHVDLELAYQSGSAGEVAHANVGTSLWLRGLELGATWRYPLFRHLEPYAHLGVGWDWATLELLDSHLEQTVSNVAGSGLVGLQVPFSLSRPFKGHTPTLLLDLGVGYVLRPGYGFHALGPPPPSARQTDPIAQSTVNAGTMPLSGFTWRLQVTFRM